jgi:hypothetical protein
MAASSATLRWLGVAAGVFAYLLFWGVELTSGERDYRGLTYAVFALVGTPVLLLVGGLLATSPRIRPFAIGLLIGVGVGVVVFGGVCVAVLAGNN